MLNHISATYSSSLIPVFSTKSANTLILLQALSSVSITELRSFLTCFLNELESSKVFLSHFLNFFLRADFPSMRFMICLMVGFQPRNWSPLVSKFSFIQLLSQMLISVIFVFSMVSVILSLLIFSNFESFSNGFLAGV